jgi:galactonate dehydratase
VVGNPPPSFGGAYFVFVKLVTDDGIVGYGEAYGATFRPHVIAAAISDLADECLIGEDPHHVERFWRRAYSRGFTQRPDVTLMGCASALEMACWDLAGKAAGVPCYELLGGRVHESLRTYTYLYPADGDPAHVYYDAPMAAQRALEEVERGFTAIKFDPAGPYTAMGGHQPRLVDIERSVEFVRTIRHAVGTRADLLVGTHGQFTAGGAIRFAQHIAPYDPLWFEEPLPNRPSRSLPASGSPPSTSSPACSKPGLLRSSNPTWRAPAGCWRARRSPRWRKRSAPNWRHIATTDRSGWPPTCSWRPARRTS